MPSFDKTPKNIDKNLIEPLINIRSDICPICKAQRIELFSFNGYPQNYKDAVEARLRGYNVSYDRYEIRYMKCRSCNKEFTIDWSSGFPVPLIDSYKSNNFFYQFINGF